MKKLSLLVVATFAFVSSAAMAMPKAAEATGGTFVSASAGTSAPKAGAARKPAKKVAARKQVRKMGKKKM